MGMVSAGTTAAAAAAAAEGGGASTGRFGGRQRSLSAFLLLSSVMLGHEMPPYLHQTARRMGARAR